MKKERTKLYTIGVVASMFNIHPQTLRLYEREGLIKPTRSKGRTRYYTEEDIQRLEFILMLSRDLGVNLAGIDIILRMREQMEELESNLQKLIEFIQKEVSESYNRDEGIKSIVLTERKDLFKFVKKRA